MGFGVLLALHVVNVRVRDVDGEPRPRRDGVGVLVVLTGVWLGLQLLGSLAGLVLVRRDGNGPARSLDVGVHDWFIAHRTGLVGISRVLAFVFDAPVLGVLVAVGTLIVVIRRRRLRYSVFGPFIAYLGAEATVFMVRLLINRSRPRSADFPATDALIGIHETSWSFPSGHATGPIAVLLALAGLVVLRRGSWWPYVVAVVVGLAVGASRLVLGVHWFTDVAVGAVLGTIWGITVCWAQRRGDGTLIRAG